MATVTEVKERALEELGVKIIGQSAQPKDLTRIATAYTEVYAYLKKRKLATWASTGTIPNEIAPHVISMMAMNAINVYGVSGERYQRIGAEASQAEREIRSLVMPDYESLEDPDDF